MHHLISLLIATRNRPNELRATLQNLKQQTIFPKLKFYFCDGNSDNANIDVINDELEWSQFEYRHDSILPIEHRRRWPHIYNFLAKISKGAYLTYWSDDVILSVPTMLEAASVDFNDVVAIPYHTVEDGEPRLQYLDRYISKTGVPVINYGLIKRRLWEQVGGLDEQFDFYFADIDLSMRLDKLTNIYPLSVEDGYVINNRHDKIWRNPLHFQLRDDSVKFYQKWGLTPGVN